MVLSDNDFSPGYSRKRIYNRETLPGNSLGCFFTGVPVEKMRIPVPENLNKILKF
jgi:hypothetical protein